MRVRPPQSVLPLHHLHRHLHLLLLLLLLIHSCSPARLLLGVMPQGRSHAGSIVPLVERLKADGHSVDLYMEAYPDEVDFGMGKQFVHVRNHSNPFASKEFGQMQWNNDFDVISQIAGFYFGAESCRNALSENPKHLQKLAEEPYDLILTDSLFSACAYGIASRSEANHVIIYSSNVETASKSMRAYGSNNVFVPRTFMSVDDAEFKPELFYYRLVGAVEWVGNVALNMYVAGLLQWLVLKDFAPAYSQAAHFSTASHAFTDMPRDIFVPYPRTNDLMEYGTYCSESRPLSPEWEQFVSSPSSKGTIVIAFGTLINWSNAPKEKLQAFVEAVRGLSDYRVIWAYNGPEVELGSHVRTAKWIPQRDLLHHNSTLLFVSHGGLKSVKESFCSSTPAVFMPMFAEQTRNAFLAKRLGLGEMVSKHSLSASGLLAAVRAILGDASHQEAANRLKSIYVDKVVPQLEESGHRLNKLLQYGGRLPDLFYPRAIHFSSTKYLSADLILLIPFALVSLLTVS